MQKLNLGKIVRSARLISGLVCLLLSLPILTKTQQLPVRIFGTADGLGSSQVNFFMRDSRGFLWFCTSDGLSRFDGSRFVTYQVGDRNSPPAVQEILETHNGIYLITTPLGIYRFDSNALSINENLNTNRPILNAELVINGTFDAHLFKDSKGNVWISGNGLYRLEETAGRVSLKKIEMDLPLNPAIVSIYDPICEGQDGSLWIGTSWGLIRRLPDGRTIFYRAEALNVNYVSDVIADGSGRIWVGRASGIYVIKPESLAELAGPGTVTVRELDDIAEVQSRPTTTPRMPEKSGEILKYIRVEGFARSDAKYLYKTSDGHIWISAGDGLVEYDGQSFHSYTTAQGLPKGIYPMTEDASGNLWLAPTNGLVRLDRQGLTTYDLGSELKTPSILAVNETYDGKLYVASAGFFLSQFEGNGFQTIHSPVPLNMTSWSNANTIFQDHTGEWWILTEEGLYRFAASQNFGALARQRPLAIYTSRNGLSDGRTFHIFEDSKGDLWVSTFGPPGGLSKWTRATNRFYTFSTAEGFPAGRSAGSFVEDHRGNLWLGFEQGGMARYAQGRFTEITTADGLPDGPIAALYIDRQDRLWVASRRFGLGRTDDLTTARPRFVSYTTDNGLSSNSVRSITGDLYGNIYAGTARGVDRLSPDAAHVKHYSVRDGLVADFVNIAFRDRGGALWFGTPNGLSRLVPRPEQQTIAPPTWLAGLRIAGENRPVAPLGSQAISNLELTHAQSNLQIDFFAVDFKEGDNLRYQYMLEGADKEWGVPTMQRTVNYANLAPGAYRFTVRAVNADGVTSAQPATISFRILAPVWQRWWFVTLALCALGAVAYAVYRYRMAQLLKVERVRTRIATDLHDDIGASLSRMAILSEVVKQQTGTNGEQSAGLLTEIADSARGLVDSMSDIVWSIDPRRDDLQSVVRRIRQFASDVLEAKGIEWELHVLPEVEKLKIDPNERQHLFLIFKEAINNVVRHGDGAKSVALSIVVQGRHLIAEIKDDGCGFTPKEPDEARSKGLGGNGLPNMRERAQQLGGWLEIASSPGAGTKLRLQVPIK